MFLLLCVFCYVRTKWRHKFFVRERKKKKDEKNDDFFQYFSCIKLGQNFFLSLLAFLSLENYRKNFLKAKRFIAQNPSDDKERNVWIVE